MVDAAVRTTSDTTDEVNGSELFAFTVEASLLFRRGAVGYSLRRKGGVLDGVEMRTRTWNMEHAVIDHVRSSYFDDLTVFPAGTATVDSAFVMRNLDGGLARRAAADQQQRRLAALNEGVSPPPDASPTASGPVGNRVVRHRATLRLS